MERKNEVDLGEDCSTMECSGKILNVWNGVMDWKSCVA